MVKFIYILKIFIFLFATINQEMYHMMENIKKNLFVYYNKVYTFNTNFHVINILYKINIILKII